MQPARRAVERNPPAERSNATRPPSDRTPSVQFARNSSRSISRKSLHSFFKMKLSSARLDSRGPPCHAAAIPPSRSPFIRSPSCTPSCNPLPPPILPDYTLVYLKWKLTNCCGTASYYTTAVPTILKRCNKKKTWRGRREGSAQEGIARAHKKG